MLHTEQKQKKSIDTSGDVCVCFLCVCAFCVCVCAVRVHVRVCHSHRKNDPVKTALGEFTPSNPEAQRLRFLLNGPVGAGKSSIVNSINTVFQGCMKIEACVAGEKTETIY